MTNPYQDYVVRIDQMFNGDWRIQFVDKVTLQPVPLERPSLFKTRTTAWEAAQTLAKWIDVEVEEVSR